jgi:hypothetical protein
MCVFVPFRSQAVEAYGENGFVQQGPCGTANRNPLSSSVNPADEIAQVPAKINRQLNLCAGAKTIGCDPAGRAFLRPGPYPLRRSIGTRPPPVGHYARGKVRHGTKIIIYTSGLDLQATELSRLWGVARISGLSRLRKYGLIALGSTHQERVLFCIAPLRLS